MNVLGLDAALGSFSCALVSDSGAPSVIELPGQVALERGLHAVHEALARGQVPPGEVDRLAVGLGPGSFTGARIAMSYAKSLAQGWRVPLVGVSSFDALEAGVAMPPNAARVTVVRGRPGVISARLSGNDGERRVSGYVDAVIGELLPALIGGSIYVLGDAEDVRSALGERGIRVEILPPALRPAALAIATLARHRAPAASLHEVRADYGEMPAVRPPRTKDETGT